jgi:hypothetical protein
MVVVAMIMIVVITPITLVVAIVPVLGLLVATLVFFMAIVLVTPPILSRALTFMRVVPRRIYLVVPTVRHEIDRPAAGVIFVAVLRPMPLVSGRHVQVQGRRGWSTRNYRHRYGHHGPGKDELGGRRHRDVSADRELAVEPG